MGMKRIATLIQLRISHAGEYQADKCGAALNRGASRTCFGALRKLTTFNAHWPFEVAPLGRAFI